MRWLSSLYTFVKDFQGIIGTIVGFTGVVITLLYNARKDRKFHLWKQEEEKRKLAAALKAELEIFASAAKNNSEMKVEPGGGLFVPKNLPKPNFYLASVDKIHLLPGATANKVITAHSVIEEYPIKLLFGLARTRAGEINTVEDRGDFYFVTGREKIRTAAEMQGSLYKIILEATQSLKKLS